VTDDAGSAQWDIVTGVGLTALGVAAGRAMETHRDDSLVSDPYAEAFVTAADPPMPIPTRLDAVGADDSEIPWASMATYMGVRTRFFDEYLTAAAAAGAAQVVLLAAGLDTRAYRLDWPAGTAVYELDAPKVLAFKDRVLAAQQATARAQRRTVAVDLRERWAPALLHAGFDPARPSAWLAEGLLPFLPNTAKDRLLSTMHELAVPGSRISVEHVEDLAALRRDPQFEDIWTRMGRRWGLDITELWPDEENYHADRWLAEHGWTVSAVPADDVAQQYGRSLTGGPIVTSVFITARR
jgi:methyltransferase (TIGR00027 family)